MASGYDLSVSTFSPDGRVFQVEYAAKAVESTGLTVGAVFKDGVLLGIEKMLPASAKLVVPTSQTRVFKLAPHVICAVAGALPDARRLVARAREECQQYQQVWGVPISGAVLADRMGLFVHAHTAIWSTRPFGCALMLAVNENIIPGPFPASGARYTNFVNADADMAEGPASDPKNYSLWIIDSTGAAYKYRGTAIARGSAAAKSELEKLNLDEMTCEEGLFEFSKIIHQAHAEIRDKEMRIEMIWLRAADGNKAALVPEDMLSKAETEAKEHIERMEVE